MKVKGRQKPGPGGGPETTEALIQVQWKPVKGFC